MKLDENEPISKSGREGRLSLVAAAFVTAGFVGWLYEAAIGLLERGWFDWGHGGIGVPFLTIYGVGALMIELLLGRESRLRRHWNPGFWGSFAAICLLTTVLEYGTGAVMLYGFGIQTWDYRVPGWDFLCTSDGLLCLRGILSFAVMGILLLYPLGSLLRYAQGRFPRSFSIVAWVFVVVIAIAIVVSYASAGRAAFV